MTTAVRYFSKGGNTESIAVAVGEAVHADALPVPDPLSGHVDLLFLGGALYAFHIAGQLKQFILGLSPSQIGAVAIFSTTGNPSGAYKQIAKQCRKAGLNVLPSEYHCVGKAARTDEARQRAAAWAEATVSRQASNAQGAKN